MVARRCPIGEMWDIVQSFTVELACASDEAGTAGCCWEWTKARGELAEVERSVFAGQNDAAS
jgi:hypothetical protein